MVTTIRLHTGFELVIMYHWYLTSFMFRLIDLVSYGSIAENCAFMLTKMSQALITLETAVVMAPVRVVKRAARIIESMMAAVFTSLLLPWSLFCLILVFVPLILSAS